MRDFGKVKAVHVFSPEFIAIDFEERSLTYRKGQDYYQTIRIEPVTGVPINSVCSIPDRGEFLAELLKVLVEAKNEKHADIFLKKLEESSAKTPAGKVQESSDYLDSLRYACSSIDKNLKKSYEDRNILGTGVVKLPNGYSVNFKNF